MSAAALVTVTRLRIVSLSALMSSSTSRVVISFVTLAGWPGKSAFSWESTAPVAASTQMVPSTVMPTLE